MEKPMSVMIAVFFVYLLILAGLAWWSRTETHSMSGYFIAGKKLPPWVVAFSGAAFGPVLLCALWYPGTNLWGAVAGMLGGFLTTMAWVLWFKAISHDLLEIIPGFGVGLLLTVTVSHATRSKNHSVA